MTSDERTEKSSFFFQGKFFENEKEFFCYADQWPSMETDEKTFERLWKHLGLEIWMNLSFREQSPKNGQLRDILEKHFHLLLNDFFALKKDKEIENHSDS